jgi:SEC-C motif-containing protein
VTAEELMRSRYSAFALADERYLLHSWHPTTRPDHVRFVEGQRWTGLQLVSSSGGPFDQEGAVEFVASYVRDGRSRELRELSRFVRHEARWVYVEGVVPAPG